jgi:hypothetical protein
MSFTKALKEARGNVSGGANYNTTSMSMGSGTTPFAGDVSVKMGASIANEQMTEVGSPVTSRTR